MQNQKNKNLGIVDEKHTIKGDFRNLPISVFLNFILIFDIHFSTMNYV